MLYVWKFLKILLFVGGSFSACYGVVSLFSQQGLNAGCISAGLASILISLLMSSNNDN